MPDTAERPALSFGGLLRQLRAEALLTQEELAEAAKLSPRSVSDLERGVNRTARKDTALLLAGALGLAEPVRGLFVAAALGRGLAEDVLAAREGRTPGAFAAAPTRSLPRDIASFTGRRGELARLLGPPAVAAAGGDLTGIWVISGMAGPARPPSRSTPRTSWPAASQTGSSSCRCTPIPVGSGRWSRPMRWAACC